MRTRHNDTVARPDGSTSVTPGLTRDPAASSGEGSGIPARGRDDEEGPTRSCILTRDRAARAALVRLALVPDGQVLPDVRAKAPGRGAWIGVGRAELTAALAKGKLKGALSRAFKGAPFVLDPALPDRIAAALERGALDRLGLEARAGNLATGSERIEAAARSGQLHALYHAADASADGAGKLAQAWRVGSGREGEGVRGLTLPVSRAILSGALGRDNVVHVGVVDRAAAGRVGEALDRWLHFVGPDPGSHQSDTLMGSPIPTPCAPAAQGSSAPEPGSGHRGRGLQEDNQ